VQNLCKFYIELLFTFLSHTKNPRNLDNYEDFKLVEAVGIEPTS